MLPNTPFVTDSNQNIPLLNETKAFEYMMEGYQMPTRSKDWVLYCFQANFSLRKELCFL